MLRPCFLVIDHEFAGSISTRKLVIETAQMNVITAYSSAEALTTLDRFPRINGIVMNATMRDMPCEELIAALKQRQPTVPIVLVTGPGNIPSAGADYYVPSFDPKQLLDVLGGLEPAAVAALDQRMEELGDSLTVDA